MPEYAVWQSMRQRCYNPSNISYKDYGAKGIKVCKRWQQSFLTFIADMGRRPAKGYQLDRIDGRGEYSPENCRWATPIEQSDNKERTHKIDFNGQKLTIREISALTGIGQATIAYRHTKGLSLDQPLHQSRLGRTPPNKGNVAPHLIKKCPECRLSYRAKRKAQMFCSNRCATYFDIKGRSA